MNTNVPIIRTHERRPIPPKTFTPVGIGVAMLVFESRPFEAHHGLDLPQKSEEGYESAMGYVVAIGPDVKQVKVGDVVLAYGDQVARTVRVNPGHRYVVLAEDRLSGVLTPEQAKIVLEREGVVSETQQGERPEGP